ncbi:hypothetical protein H2198_003500 [Neophaeococcomyces mojaviensis]|uniref:Uncharacterized protein n=1 Tax=Neophaeococcomyces mojaviensis TaxID=3383035 RepID=A0ACC3AC12_9EURO|nr:hypothetical protein H2198_003500 [Knufia sp. JES_112]
MSAEAFGKRVLQDVHEESLNELLVTLRTIHNAQPRSTTGVPLLDRIIEDSRYPAAIDANTPFSFPADINLDIFNPDRDLDTLNDHDDPQSPTYDLGPMVTHPKPLIINVSLSKPGARPAATNLLKHLTILSILPHVYGGKQGCVTWIDLSNSFSVKILYQHILSNIRSKVSTTRQESARQTPLAAPNNRLDSLRILAEQALQHVHVIHCVSTRQLLSTIQNLPTYLLNPSDHRSFDRTHDLVIIDSINHFHWVDRFDAEIARLEGTRTGISASNETSLTNQITSELRSLHQRLGCTVVYTSHPTVPNTSQNPAWTGVSGITLPAPPQTSPPSNDNAIYDPFHASALVTLTPVSATVNVSKFASTMTVEECLRDKEKRKKAVSDNSRKWWFDARYGGLAVTGARRREERWNDRRGFSMEVKEGTVVFD